jgi:serine palmitoyltransferase
MTVSTIFPNVYFLGQKAGESVASLLQSQESPTITDGGNASALFPTLQTLWLLIKSFPLTYKQWWLNLVANDPVHVAVETTLIVSIVYILVSRSNDWKEVQARDKLTDQEQDELVREWKLTGRAPLVPSETNNTTGSSMQQQEEPNDVVVHKIKGRWMQVQLSKDEHDATGSLVLETVLNFATFDFLGMSADGDDRPEVAAADKKRASPTLSSSDTDSSDKNCSNNSNSTSASNNPVKIASTEALNKYGCGSCGPRGFYGTMDVHLQVEQEFSRFVKTDGAIMYSDGASTCSSTIAAFAKRGDLLVVDEGIYEPLLTGVTLSRAHVKWFKHNDMQDLRRVLEKVQLVDQQLGRAANAQRRFIVVEGLYKNTGTIVPLDELVQLKHEFSYRLILDESFSFGALGKSGRGVTELYQKRLMHDVEIATIGLENAVGSIGGLTVGNDDVVDHQRLSGSGYCFSASTPPFAAVAAMKALEIMQTKPEILQRLNHNRVYLHDKLQEFCSNRLEDLLLVTSDRRSPIVFLQVAAIPETEHLDESVFLREVARESLARGVALVATGQLASLGPARTEPPPGIRMTVSAAHNEQDMNKALQVLGEAVDIVMSRFQEESTL